MRVQLVMAAWLPARGYGGPIAKIERLAPGLAAAGVDLTIVTSTLNAPGSATLPPGLDTSLSPPVMRLSSHVNFRWSTWAIWPQQLPPADVVHVLGAWNGLAYQAIERGLAAGQPVLWEPSGMLPVAGRHRLLKRALTPWHQRLAARVTAMIWTSQRERQEAPFAVADGHSAVRPNAAPPAPPRTSRVEARRRLNLPAAGRLWGYLGRINQRKGIEVMLAAWPGATTAAQLIFAGPVELPSLAALIDSGVPGVRRMGALDAERAWLFLQAIDALVLVPDFGENFGNVVVEAALVGTPVVASAAVGAAEFFADDPGVRVLADVEQLATVFRAGEVPPPPRGAPLPLLPENVVHQQVQLYESALK